MTELLEKSIQTLELPRVLAMLADEAVTEEGKETCRKVRPQTVVSDVSRLQKQTSAAFQMLVKHGTPSFSGVRPVAAALQRADRGGALNTRELLDIAQVLRCARNVREYGVGESTEKTVLDGYFHSLSPNRFLEEKISGSILGEDATADSASPERADIRRHLSGCAKVIVLAVTIGADIDRTTERLFSSSSRKAVIFDSAASCLVESLADDVCDELPRKYGPPTARFSGGYGDFPLAAQRDICSLLRADTRIGLCVDAGGSLVPRKSITALLGVKGDGKPFPFSQADKCALCANANCAARNREPR